MATYRFLCKSRRRVEGLVIDWDDASVGSEARDGAFAAFLKEQCLGPWRRDKHDPGSEARPSSLFFGGPSPLASERACSTRSEECHYPFAVATVPCTSSEY